jgi:hypothetical protein
MRRIENIRREQLGAPGREGCPEFWTERFAKLYQQFIGITPTDREKLRTGLEGIIDGSRTSVANVLASINAGTFTQTGSPAEGAAEAGLSEWL